MAFWADSLMISAMITYALGEGRMHRGPLGAASRGVVAQERVPPHASPPADPFRRVLESRGNQMAYCFQGINRLSLIFQQLTIGSGAVTVVTGLEAAAKFPQLVPGTSAVFFGLASECA